MQGVGIYVGDRDSGLDFMGFEVTCSGLRVQGLALSADEFEGSSLMVESLPIRSIVDPVWDNPKGP